MTLYQNINRTCPLCGGAREWQPGVIRHRIAAGNYVHIKFPSGPYWRVVLLKNGKALDENGVAYL